MQKISKILTVTGVDESVDNYSFSRIVSRFDFIEAAILWQDENTNGYRFPSLDWIHDFLETYPILNKSIHLCGGAIEKFYRGDRELFNLIGCFNRVQLNILTISPTNFREALDHLENTGIDLIIPHHGCGGIDLNDYSERRLHILHDRSRGKGILPRTWPPVVRNYRNGYAGGLNPSNMTDSLAKIETASSGYWHWVDLESGLRSKNDSFDIARLEDIALKVAKYLEKHQSQNEIIEKCIYPIS